MAGVRKTKVCEIVVRKKNEAIFFENKKDNRLSIITFIRSYTKLQVTQKMLVVFEFRNLSKRMQQYISSNFQCTKHIIQNYNTTVNAVIYQFCCIICNVCFSN